jgi:hypothetical protein
MAFLDNSGDIILDAVLTDTGRLRLARGDGSFKITKYAFGDDEVNYGLYDKNNTSGSAYYDLDILQMPVFEAFTNNTSVLKYPLLSISRTNLLYLPVLKINNDTSGQNVEQPFGKISSISGSFLVAVSNDTITNSYSTANVIDGRTPPDSSIQIDQGIDADIGVNPNDITGEQLNSFGLKETQYLIQLDNRLASLVGPLSKNVKAPSFIDDDNIASYFLSLSSDTDSIQNIKTDSLGSSTYQVIAGPRGTAIGITFVASNALQTSSDLFIKLGGEVSIGTNTYYYIDTNVVVKGVTTGSSITIPVRFIRYKTP